MSNLIEQASSQLRELISKAAAVLTEKGQLPEVPVPDFAVEIPADKSHGDFAANIAMVGARSYRMAPVKIAELILSEISLEGTLFERAEIAGPGFMNFFLGRKWFSDVIRAVNSEKDNYGKTDTGKGKKVLVELYL